MKAILLLSALLVADKEPIRTKIGEPNIFAGYSLKAQLEIFPTALPNGAQEALDEVNAYRARLGLRPFVYHEGLTVAAARCAVIRAANGITGHLGVRPDRGPSEYSYLPSGIRADATGCGWASPGHHWLTCCTEENWTHAGAAWAQGADGYRYMHLFVSNAGNNDWSCPPGG